MIDSFFFIGSSTSLNIINRGHHHSLLQVKEHEN